ncbi:MAG: hypothetical protein IGS48_12955 [Oscillatoriales cyanobacterium C42_A2020_001]|nr:hypothetical protein [Leptolyngbyaceae cyanobacterium C42_A2020_001]
MPSLGNLQRRISTLEAEIEAIKQEGEYLLGVRLERSPAGGTASINAKEECKYARLRSGRGKLLPNGKKSMYVPVGEIARYDAACKRGEQIQKLERQLSQVKVQVAKLELSQYRSLNGGVVKPRGRQKVVPFPSEAAATPIVIAPPPVPIVPAAILVLYRQHANAPVHAVAAEVWQGDQRIAEVKPVHCMGMKGDRVSAYIKEVLVSLNQQFQVTRFEDVVREIPVEQCPIDNCPLSV